MSSKAWDRASDYLDTNIAGVTHRNSRDGTDRQRIVQKCQVGEAVILICEPDNPVDETAVAVVRYTGEQLGYLPQDMSQEYFSATRNGVEYQVAIKSIGRPDGSRSKPLGVLIEGEKLDPSKVADIAQIRGLRRRIESQWMQSGRKRTGCSTAFVAIVLLAFLGLLAWHSWPSP